MVTCPQCGSQQPDGTAFCDNCGAALSGPGAVQAPPQGGAQGIQPGAPTVVASNSCPSCGFSVPPGEAFCPNCGAQLGAGGGAAPEPAPQPSYSPQQQAGPPPSPPGAGKKLNCPNCGAQLEPDSSFCDMCGNRIEAPAQSAPSPQPPQQDQWQQPQQPQQPDAWQQPQQQPQQQPPSRQQQPQPQPPAQPVAGMQARLIVQGTNATLPFPPGKQQVIMGREDPVSGIFPEIDLTDHGGDEGGVSRKHARIYTQGGQFYIEDLQSVNFTFVNQEKVLPGQPQRLKSGDEIRLGRVKLTFQRM